MMNMNTMNTSMMRNEINIIKCYKIDLNPRLMNESEISNKDVVQNARIFLSRALLWHTRHFLSRKYRTAVFLVIK